MSRMVCQGNVRFRITYASVFDSSACNLLIDTTGSYSVDTFDCYTVGEDIPLPNAGYGFSTLWNVSTSSYLNPSNVSGVMGHWDANAITASHSASLSIWEDISGNARHLTQSNAALQPIFQTNQLPTSGSAVRFYDQYFMVPDISGQSAYEVFILIRVDLDPPLAVQQSGLWKFGPTGASNATQFPSQANGWIYDNFASTVQKPVGDVGTNMTKWMVYNSFSKSGLWQARVDGALAYSTTTNTVTMPTGGLTFGYENYNNGTLHIYLRGQVAMWALFSRALETYERKAVFRYFDLRRSYYE